MILKPDQFANQLPKWYSVWRKANPGCFPLEQRLSQKAYTVGYLEMEDLVAITRVLGNPHNIRGRVEKQNTEQKVKEATGEAIRRLSHPANALKSMLSIRHWGLAYATKTLRCICPSRYVALDSKLHQGIDRRYFPATNEVQRYVQFLGFCEQLRQKVLEPGPRDGEWFLADIEIALWQFVWNHGKIVNDESFFA